MQTATLRLDTLSDDALLARLAEVLRRGRRVEAELVWHLAEVDRRRLYLLEACPSMHVYAMSRLHLSEAEAYLRITVARLSRRFPVVLAMLADGRLHVSAVATLAPHLREENHEALLARAVHRSKREIEALVAEIAPQPDAPSLMRRLPSAPVASATAGLGPGRVGRREVTDQPMQVGDRSAPVSSPAQQVARSDSARRHRGGRRVGRARRVSTCAGQAGTGTGHGSARTISLPGPVHGQRGASRQDHSRAGAAPPSNPGWAGCSHKCARVERTGLSVVIPNVLPPKCASAAIEADA